MQQQGKPLEGVRLPKRLAVVRVAPQPAATFEQRRYLFALRQRIGESVMGIRDLTMAAASADIARCKRLIELTLL